MSNLWRQRDTHPNSGSIHPTATVRHWRAAMFLLPQALPTTKATVIHPRGAAAGNLVKRDLWTI